MDTHQASEEQWLSTSLHNAHEWLARKPSVHHVRYGGLDNVFLRIEDLARAQKFADRFQSLNRPES